MENEQRVAPNEGRYVFNFDKCNVGHVGDVDGNPDVRNWLKRNILEENVTMDRNKQDKKEEDDDVTELLDLFHGLKDKTPTRLEKILTMQEESAKYCNSQQDHEAFGLLETLCKFGPSVCMLPTYINFYDTLLKTERGEEAEGIFDIIFNILTTRVKVSFKECKRLANKYRKEKMYFKSMLFHLIEGKILLGVSDADRVLVGVQSFMLGIKLCVMAIAEECSYHCNTLKYYVVPKVRHLHQSIFRQVKGKSKKALVRVEVLCMHHLEISERFAGDIKAGELTLNNSITRLESVLGENAKKVHLYGAALNNLGAMYIQTKRPRQAMDVLAQAIEINMNAEDYTSEEERQEDVNRSSSALNKAEEMIQQQQE